MRSALLIRGFSVFSIALLSACGSGDRPLDEVDPGAVADDPTYQQVFAIIDRECAPCHEEGKTDPPGLVNCTDIVALRSDILQQVEENTMPPGAWPRLTSEEKLIIRRWVENGAPAPCN